MRDAQKLYSIIHFKTSDTV